MFVYETHQILLLFACSLSPSCAISSFAATLFSQKYRMYRRILIWLQFLLMSVVWGTGVQAQTAPGLTTGFRRDINRYRWTSGFQLDRQIGAWRAVMRNDYLSEAFLLGRSISDFRDEEKGIWSLGRPIGPQLEADLSGSFEWYSLSNAIAGSAYAGLRYAPSEAVSVAPAVGVAVDRRPTSIRPDDTVVLRTDTGPAFGYAFLYQPARTSDRRFSVAGSGNWQFISPRRSRTFETTVLVGRTFNKTDIQIQSAYSNGRRDAYQSASFLNRDVTAVREPETIESTTNDTLAARLRIQRPLPFGLAMESHLEFSSHRRFVRAYRKPEEALFFDTDFNRRIVDAEIALNYRKGADAARFAIQTGATVEQRRLANRNALPPGQAALKGNLLRRADFDRGFLSLAGSWQANPFDWFSFQASGSAHIVRRDTPEENDDDRDELYQNGRLGLLFRLGRYVEADVRAIGTIYHTVYLKATRSGENNRQRSLRLRPGLRWRPSSNTSVRFLSEVRATYTVDDFDLGGKPRNDQSARELRYELDLEHRPAEGVRVLVDGSVSDLHLGRLIWSRFAEIPFDTLRTWGLWGRLSAGRTWTAEIGARAFVRRDFDNRTSVSYDRIDSEGMPVRDAQGHPVRDMISRPGREWIEQFGPTCAVSWSPAGGSTIRVDGWIQIQRIRQQLFGPLPPEEADRIVEAASSGNTRIIPNLSMEIAWRF